MTSYLSSSLSLNSGTTATMLSPSTNGAKATTKSPGFSSPTSGTPNTSNKYPHTRAQLSYIARQYKPSLYASSGYDNTDNGDADNLTSNEADLNGSKHGVSQSLVNEAVALLGEEKDEELKTLLKETYGMDDERAEQNVLDLMHKHRDDVAGVPFLYLTPAIARRPISRPSSRASTNSASKFRPETPNNSSSAPSSPLIHHVLYMQRRPHTPAMTSPLAPSQGSATLSIKSDYSPSSSPILPSTNPTSTPIVTTQAQWTASLPASPISSPRLLSAKASEFRPIPRPLSAAATHPHTQSSTFLLSRNDTPSPDLWAHSSSPRAPSNLAIAAPLVADHSPASRPSTPAPVSKNKTGNTRNGDNEGLDGGAENGDDPFDPFNPANAVPSFVSEFDSAYDASMSSGLWGQTYPNHYPYPGYGVPDIPSVSTMPAKGGQPPQMLPHLPDPTIDSEESSMLTDGMTPFDVLTTVFGSTLAPSELEDALKVNGFDFDQAMSWLIDGYPGGGPTTQQGQGPPGQGQQPNNGRMQQVGSRVSVVSRDAIGVMRGAANGRGGYAAGSVPPNPRAPRYVNGRPVPSGNRVCRYFVAGECLRADCRFSHDLERALCRFWLRGTCAKQESCEFLHHLPKDVDVNALNALIARNNYVLGPLAVGHAIGANANSQGSTANSEEFPALGFDPNQGGPQAAGRVRKFGAYDPSRTRFANAVKKPAPPPSQSQNQQGTQDDAASSTLTIIAPKASPRLKLRPPTLVPTLPTGEAINKLYLSYRTRALQLGAQRNSCLSRAAESWRRRDGAGAKRWSREGEELNRRMREEMAVAAGDLVRERARVVEGIVRERGAGAAGSDPSDRAVRGKVMGGGLGVCLGIASRGVGGGGSEQSSEERTEVMVDLHGLHANEATEVLESFLLALEQEHFLGLAYAIVGEEKHTGTGPVVTLGNQQDSTSATSSSATKASASASSSSTSGATGGGPQNANGNLNPPGRTGGATSRRLASGVKEWLHRWGYPWSERDGVICIDPLTHLSD